MAEIMRLLRNDHGNFVKLLNVLDRQIVELAAGGRADFDLLGSIVEYSLNYPDLCHHPKEDRVYKKLRDRDPAAARDIGDLEDEHRRLAAVVRRLAAAIATLRRDSELGSDGVVAVAREYMGFLHRHMEMEEQRFFPAAVQALTLDDWAAIDAAFVSRADPLFGPTVNRAYQLLHDEISHPGQGWRNGRPAHGPRPVEPPTRPATGERRRQHRMETFLSGILTGSDSIHDCSVLDVSPQGAMVRASEPLESGAAFALEVARIGGFRSRGKDILGPGVGARVVWSRDDRAGLQFVGDADAIARTMDGILSQAGWGSSPGTA